MIKQYTIRSIPATVDRVLRNQSRKTGKSFNSTVIEALERATGVSSTTNVYTDLDDLIGVGIADQKNFEKAMSELEDTSSYMDSNFSL